MEMSRCILFEKKLPRFLWAETVNTSVYLLNRLQTKFIQSKTSLKVWSSVQPTTKHLKVFGSLCYFHVPSVKRGKLNEIAEKGIFVGYASESKGYRIYNPNGAKIHISKDVHFDENSCRNWDIKKVDQTTTATLEPVVERFGVEDRLDIEATSNSQILKVKPLSDVYERCNLVHAEPTSYTEAPRFPTWIDAMKSKIDSIERNKTWRLTELSKGKKEIGVK